MQGLSGGDDPGRERTGASKRGSHIPILHVEPVGAIIYLSFPTA